MPRVWCWASWGLAALIAASPLGAQQPVPRDTTRRAPDTTQAVPATQRPASSTDSTQNPRPDRPVTPRDTSRALPDSTNPDSLRPLMPPATQPGPRPGQTRFVFGPDEIRWSGAISMSELLLQIPGVFAVKAGSYGQPETVSYMGQGGVSVELYRDGYQLDPMGEDSIGFDLSRFDIGSYQRIEVEVDPTVLRINLVTETQASLRPKTEASFATGDNNTNSYRVRYLNRWRSGAGVSLGVAYAGTQGPSTSRASSNEITISAKISWIPNDRSGVEFQAQGYNLSSDTITPLLGGTPYLARSVRRSDIFVRAFAASRADGMGLRFESVLGSSVYGDDTHLFNRSEGQGSFTLGYRATHWSAESWTRLRDTEVPIELGAQATFAPLRVLTLSGYGRRRSTLDNQYANEASGAAELRPLHFLTVHGAVRWRELSGSLFVADPIIERISDYNGGVGLTSRLLDLDVSYTERGDFAAQPFGVFAPQVPAISPIGTDAIQVSYAFKPRRWFTISGWFRNPSGNLTSYDPPTHSVTELTFRSAFLPTYRRGVFDLEVKTQFEAWGGGIMGIDSTGTHTIPLVGHSVMNWYVQFRLVGAIIYWAMRNSQFEHYTLLPGFAMPRSLQRFGIRWEFAN